jgi:transposase
MRSDSEWDGLAGVVTNVTDSTLEVIWSHYRGLWQIEACFRVQKHDLRMRPIYHSTPKRIKAHTAISFMAFVCVRYLEYRLSLQSQKLLLEEIRKALMSVQASVIHDRKNEKSYLLPTTINTHAKKSIASSK